MTVTPLTGTIGAVVTGIDLGGKIADEVMHQIERALNLHGVLVFQGQNVAPEAQVRFGSWFGDLHRHHSGRVDTACPEIYVLEGYSRDIEWHADITYEECPARLSVLRAVTLPTVGGDTIWTSTVRAYDTLSSSMQHLVDELHARHDSSALNARDPHLEIRSATHPVVIDHPYNGRRSLFVNRMFTKRILGMSERESREILELLYDAITQPTNQVRWRWSAGDVVMWDNFATQHFVVVDYDEARTMHRVTARGLRPTSSVLSEGERREEFVKALY